MNIKSILAGAALAVTLPMAASAATLDFTDNSSCVQTAASCDGSAFGTTFSVTAAPAGAELTYTAFDGSMDTPLADQNDGIGVDFIAGSFDEVNGAESLTITFADEVTLVGASFLDLFFDEETEEQETVIVYDGASTADTEIGQFSADDVFQSGSGFFTADFDFTGTAITFAILNGQNDGVGVADFSLAAVYTPEVPLPAAGFLLLGGLGGLAALKRRKKA